MQIKGIIFDMDGLMFNTEQIGYQKMIKVTKDFGYELPCCVLDKTIGVNRNNTIKILKEYFGDGFPIEKILEKRRGLLNEYFNKNGVPLKEGLIELLNYLDEYKIKKVVATSSYRKIAENLLISSKLLNRFDDIICGDEIKKSKPSPDIFLKALDKLKLSANEAIVLEDSKMGILAAYRANIKAIMVPDIILPDEKTKRMYFKECKTLLEVKKLISELNKV